MRMLRCNPPACPDCDVWSECPRRGDPVRGSRLRTLCPSTPGVPRYGGGRDRHSVLHGNRSGRVGGARASLHFASSFTRGGPLPRGIGHLSCTVFVSGGQIETTFSSVCECNCGQ